MRTLIRGGWIVAFQDDHHAILRDGVVVWEDDRILHVGPEFDGTVDREIDASNMLVSPGFRQSPCRGQYRHPDARARSR